MIATTLVEASQIQIGDHAVTGKLFGLPVDVDVVWSTLIAATIVIVLVWLAGRKATAGVPGKLQLVFETVIEQVQDLAEGVIGPEGRQIVPLAVCLFLFILACNWLGFIPARYNHDWLLPPTADVDLPLAMALTVWIGSIAKAIQVKGLRGYLRHFAQPYAIMAPINVIEEITKPVTLTFRLFGNVFSATLMVLVLAYLFPWPVTIIGELLWKPFDLFIGFIQAFIFALLTIMYFGMAMSKEGH